jgi:hypothetical protein
MIHRRHLVEHPPRPPLHAAACLLLLALLAGCAAIGTTALSNGRPAYNAVINETEDQQILSMIVRRRYGETFGMLAGSSVTASLRVGASVGANAGIGPSENYAGNLVPLSAGVTYEENPTISYIPLRGEQFIERMLTPVSAEQVVLLSRMSKAEVEVLRLLVRRANGIVNPLYASRPTDARAFDRFVELYVRLRETGSLDIVRSKDNHFDLLLHDYAGDAGGDAAEFLRLLRLQPPGPDGSSITVPLRFFVGAPRPDALDLETPSALEIIEAAASGVDVPDEHVAQGLSSPPDAIARNELISIHSSPNRPGGASIAVMHRGWWYFVDERDSRSKQAFMILRTLIGLRLDDVGPVQARPVLTVPVSR